MTLIVQANRSMLLLIDLQSKLVPATVSSSRCLEQAQLLIEAARTLDVPILASEHCPGGIGKMVPLLRNQLEDKEIAPKLHFDASAEPAVMAKLSKLDRQKIIVAGMETHVCVLQTILGLKGRGFDPVLVADATSSRTTLSRDLAIERMRHHGIEIVSTEMVIFEWLGVAGTPAFKTLLPMIKAGRVDPPAAASSQINRNDQ